MLLGGPFFPSTFLGFRGQPQPCLAAQPSSKVRETDGEIEIVIKRKMDTDREGKRERQGKTLK